MPTANDRLLSTQLGVKATELLAAGTYNVLVAIRSGECVPVPLEEVAGVKKLVPPDHPWLKTARMVGTCLGISNRDLRELMGRPQTAPREETKR